MKRIAIIGNGGGGKSRLARKLSETLGLPLTHVDSIQYLAGMKVREIFETRKLLNEIVEQENWIIDGFGPMDVMEKRFSMADKVVLIDFPIWRHYWWASKRQFKSLWSPRVELPDYCNEATFAHTLRLYKILWRVHSEIRPQLLKIFSKPDMTGKVKIVKTVDDWNLIFKNGLA